MPRIAATSIAEHVQQQNARITEAARRLFSEQGFGATDMSQIAAEIGLARNSLYRYFPNKDHILLACIQEDMLPHMERMQVLAVTEVDGYARVQLWLELQFEMAMSPAHATMEMMSEIKDASLKLNRDIRQLHEAPNAVLTEALLEIDVDVAGAESLASMINGMVLAATARALRLPQAERPAVLAELSAVVNRLVAKD